MLEKKRWLQSWGFGVVFFLCALFAWQASAQTLIEGVDGTGARRRVLVDATGKIILSTAAALGLVQVTGVNGTSAASLANPFPVKLGDGTVALSPPWGLAGLGAATNCVSMDTAGQEIAITDGWHRIKAIGNGACLLTGAAGATNAALTCGAGTMGYQMSEGEWLVVYITDAVLAVKAPTTVTGDLLCVMRLNGAT